jgi:hypothetical protein
MTAESPRFPTSGINSNQDLEQHLNAKNLKFERTTGDYGGHENSYIVHNPTREAMYELGHKAGQEAILYGQNGKHELHYTHGPDAGKYHPSLPLTGFSKDKPEGYYTALPGHGHVTLHFDFDKKLPSPTMNTIPASHDGPSAEVAKPQLTAKSEILLTIFGALRKALLDDAPLTPHPHAYPYHEGHTSHHQKTKGHGVLLNSEQFMAMRKLAKNDEPVTFKGIANGLLETLKKAMEATKAPDASTPQPTFAKHTTPFGTIKKGKTSDLKHYPLHGVGAKVDQLVKDHGHTSFLYGGKHGKPDFSSKNYDTKHLGISSPEAASGGDPDHQDYVSSWRKLHELAHSLTLPEVNAKYGEGKRTGSLGKQRTLREAKRAVEWEEKAVDRQRQLTKQIGIEIPDNVFHKEKNTIMADAVHRATAGKFTEPSEEGFTPHSHPVPLSVAHGMLDDHAKQLGLADEHSLLPKK